MRIFLVGFIPDFLESPEKGGKYFESFIRDKIINIKNECRRFLKINDGNENNIQKTEDGKVDTAYYIEAITNLKKITEEYLTEIVKKKSSGEILGTE